VNSRGIGSPWPNAVEDSVRAFALGGGVGLVTALASVLVDGDGPTLDEGSDGGAVTVGASVAGIVDEIDAGAQAISAIVSAASAATAPGRAYFVDRIEAWRISVRG